MIFLVLSVVECAVFLAVYIFLRVGRVRDVRWTIGIVVAAALTTWPRSGRCSRWDCGGGSDPAARPGAREDGCQEVPCLL